MNERETSGRGSGAEPIRKSVSVMLVLFLLAAAAGTLFFVMRQRNQHREETARAQPATPEFPVRESNQSGTVVPPAETPPSTLIPAPPAIPQTSEKPSLASPEQTAGPAATAQTRQLVSNLAQLNMTNGPVNAEKLAAWQQTLQQLTNSGPAGVGAIREFLHSKADMNFDSIGGAAAMGQ